jgi:hypothetical protein
MNGSAARVETHIILETTKSAPEITFFKVLSALDLTGE